MARQWRVNTDFRTPFIVLEPEIIKTSSGTTDKKYPDISTISEEYKQAHVLWGTFKSYGGTDNLVNGVYSVIDTATIQCWYHPSIEKESRILLLDSNKTYEVTGEPEDVNLEHYILNVKLRRVMQNG